MPQNSGYEQTNERGMDTMENFKKLSKRVVGMYAPGANLSSLSSLQELSMHTWLKSQFMKYDHVADTLFKILKFLKSQEKSQQDKFKELVHQFTLEWDTIFQDNDIFNKHNFLICHMPTFAAIWEMIGIVNEESFEAFHSCLARVKDQLKSMPYHLLWVETINARMQSLLKEEIMELTMAVESVSTGKKTGPQTKKRKLLEDNVTHVLNVFDEKTVNGVEFMVLPCDALIKKEWKNIYMWFTSAKAPQSLMDKFNASAPLVLSEVKETSAQFSRF